MALSNYESEKITRAELSAKLQGHSVRGNGASPSVIEDMLPPPSYATLTPIGNRDYLDPSSKVTGKLEFAGPARIDGLVDGEINAQDSLAIGQSAIVMAKIKAGSIIVAGTVSGELCAERIELYPSANVSGDLSAPRLVIHEGAVFEGHCAMQQGARADRKVAEPRQDERTRAQIDNQDKF